MTSGCFATVDGVVLFDDLLQTFDLCNVVDVETAFCCTWTVEDPDVWVYCAVGCRLKNC